jgi:peroxiredoxin
MFRTISAAFAAAALTIAPAAAELEVGETAPDFTVEGFQGGEAVSFTLSEALEEGPVVMFFFPAAYTSGCEAQAANFAENIGLFEAYGAQVIGVTGGNTDRLSDFSEQHCASAFPVFAAADGMAGDYEVRSMRPGWTNRTTFVIGEDASIALVYKDGSPYPHVDESLEVLAAMHAGDDSEGGDEDGSGE